MVNKNKFNKSLFLFGVANLLWVLFRTGTKPSRIVYPCQRAALANGLMWLRVSISFSLVGTLAGVLTKTKKFSSKKGRTLALIIIVASVVVSSEQFWGILQPALAVDPNQEIELTLEPRNATAFPASDIYVVNARVSAHINALIDLMGSHGLLFYKSSTIGVNQGPDGLIARDDVVLIKINEQWSQRGGTNTDVLKELIQAVVDHPDGFVGEIVVADNGQGYGSMDWSQSNAEDHTQSTQDVVDMFSPSYKVSTYDWQPIRGKRVDEYSEGDMTDGYILYDTADPETGIYVSYPKFETEFGTYISFKYGLWNGTGYEKRLKVINMPVLKSHWTYSVTASVKHYMGVQSEGYAVGGGLANGHSTVGRGGMGTLMVETGLPTLNIIDAIWINANPPTSSMSGPETYYSWSTRVNVLMASADPVALDYWAAKYVLVQAASIIGYIGTPYYYESTFGRWLNLTKDEIVAGGYNVTTDENHMNVNVCARATYFADLNNDGKVDILDIAIVAKAFGTQPGDEDWNEIADMDKNGEINILDIAAVAKDYGKTAQNAVIALYSDEGTWEESVQAAEKMFQWMGYAVTLVNANYINDKGLDNFSILCVPGGNMYQYSQDISSTGMENIKNFIRNGGGYFGICGGVYFAAEKVVWQGNKLPMTPLGIFPGTAEGPINEIVPYPNYTMCKVNIVDSVHPITRSEPDSALMLYYWGPILLPTKDANVTILGNYGRGNQPTMLAFEYGVGRVFLIGTHPEIEEDSERDGVAFADELDDQGSDWDLMRKAVLWSLKK